MSTPEFKRFNPDKLFEPFLEAIIKSEKDSYYNPLISWETYINQYKMEFHEAGVRFQKRITNAYKLIKDNADTIIPDEESQQQIEQEINELDSESFPFHSINGIYKLGCMFYNEKQYQEAADIFFLLIQLAPLNYNVWIMLGMSEQWLQNYEYAARIYFQATLINREYPEPFFYLVQCYIHMNDKISATHFAKIILENKKWKIENAQIYHNTEKLISSFN